MPIQVQNHSDGTLAGVTPEHQLEVEAEIHELQHHMAFKSEQSYQALAVDAGITAENQTILEITNDDPKRKCVISFIRVQAITNTASKPVVGEYFQLGVGSVDTGGTATYVPVNTSAGSGKVASVTVRTADPTQAGTFSEIDRWYNEGNGEQAWNKQGSIVLGLNQSFAVRFLSAGTGEAVVRVTFMMIDNP